MAPAGKGGDRGQDPRPVKADLVVHPPGLVEMTDEQYREAVRLLVTLIDGYVARHQVLESDHQHPQPGAGQHGVKRRAAGEEDSFAVEPATPERVLLADAVQAWLRAQPDRQAQYQEQLAMVDGEIRRNEQAVERYLLAFEAGTLQAEVCGDRVRVLAQATAGLRSRREELVAQLEGAGRSGGTTALMGWICRSCWRMLWPIRLVGPLSRRCWGFWSRRSVSRAGRPSTRPFVSRLASDVRGRGAGDVRLKRPSSPTPGGG
jgi:hypothetical protein